jgi:hypothetical protein
MLVEPGPLEVGVELGELVCIGRTGVEIVADTITLVTFNCVADEE